MFKYSKRSNSVLITTHHDIQSLFRLVIKRTPIDIGIPTSGGKRTAIEQNALYKDKKSQCDGVVKKSKHQTGRAIDFYAYLNGKASYDKIHLSIVAGIVLSCAKELSLKVRWGGTFGCNDYKGWDYCHFELV